MKYFKIDFYKNSTINLVIIRIEWVLLKESKISKNKWPERKRTRPHNITWVSLKLNSPNYELNCFNRNQKTQKDKDSRSADSVTPESVWSDSLQSVNQLCWVQLQILSHYQLLMSLLLWLVFQVLLTTMMLKFNF